MDEKQRLSVFQAQTQNVRSLSRTWALINRQINDCIRVGNGPALDANTKFLAVLYCALSEATFSKLLHTPHGLELCEIEQVKAARRMGSGIKDGWLKCAEVAIRRVEGGKYNHQVNARKKLGELIETYIFDPTLIRNKLAHGQWTVALNRENTDINQELTRQLVALDVVELYRREQVLRPLAAIIEDMIESPDRAHFKDYWKHLARIEDTQRTLSKWTMERKRKQLLAKRPPSRKNA